MSLFPYIPRKYLMNIVAIHLFTVFVPNKAGLSAIHSS